jgi:hypothetical protein
MLVSRRMLQLLLVLPLAAAINPSGRAQCHYHSQFASVGSCPDGVSCRSPQCVPSQYASDSCALLDNADCLCPGATTVSIPRGTTSPGGCSTCQLPTVTQPTSSMAFLSKNLEFFSINEAVKSVLHRSSSDKQTALPVPVSTSGQPSSRSTIEGITTNRLHRPGALASRRTQRHRESEQSQ